MSHPDHRRYYYLSYMGLDNTGGSLPIEKSYLSRIFTTWCIQTGIIPIPLETLIQELEHIASLASLHIESDVLIGFIRSKFSVTFDPRDSQETDLVWPQACDLVPISSARMLLKLRSGHENHKIHGYRGVISIDQLSLLLWNFPVLSDEVGATLLKHYCHINPGSYDIFVNYIMHHHLDNVITSENSDMIPTAITIKLFRMFYGDSGGLDFALDTYAGATVTEYIKILRGGRAAPLTPLPS